MNQKLVELGLSIILLGMGTVGCNVIDNKTPTPQVLPTTAESLSCRTDIDCNPGIADPDRFDSRCLNSDGTRNRPEFDGDGTCH